MITIKVGIIGYSEGNGHPYSFAAILNGYDYDKMKKTSYPGIANYLSARKTEEFGISNLKATHVWAPDKKIAESIAKSTHIRNISDHYESMVDEVDAVLILRDDPDSHRKIAEPFLENGKTVFIDKPLCINTDDLSWFTPWLENGQLMSCSGFRYYPSIANKLNGKIKQEKIVFSHGISIIDWFRYGIHILEGITPVMGINIDWVQDTGEDKNQIVRIQYKNGTYALIQVNTSIGFILRNSFYTESNNHFTIDFDDNFSCFRGLLQMFYKQIQTGTPSIRPDETKNIIKVLIAGNHSLNNGGKRVKIDNI